MTLTVRRIFPSMNENDFKVHSSYFVILKLLLLLLLLHYLTSVGSQRLGHIEVEVEQDWCTVLYYTPTLVLG